MSEKVNEKLLIGGWLHSHEEDTEGATVFRRDTEELPPSRGRVGYEFREGGKLAQQGPGPSDRSISSEGTWVLDKDGQLILSPGNDGEQSFLVQSLDEKRLVLNRTSCIGGENMNPPPRNGSEPGGGSERPTQRTCATMPVRHSQANTNSTIRLIVRKPPSSGRLPPAR